MTQKQTVFLLQAYHKASAQFADVGIYESEALAEMAAQQCIEEDDIDRTKGGIILNDEYVIKRFVMNEFVETDR